MRFSLRTLLIFMIVVGPIAACGWQGYVAYQDWKAKQASSVEPDPELLQLGSRNYPTIYDPAIQR